MWCVQLRLSSEFVSHLVPHTFGLVLHQNNTWKIPIFKYLTLFSEYHFLFLLMIEKLNCIQEIQDTILILRMMLVCDANTSEKLCK